MDWRALSVSLSLGIGTVVVLLPFGIWLGHTLAGRHFRGKGFVEAIVAVPLILPPTVLGFYLLVAFGARSPLGAAFEAIAGQALAFSFWGLLLASAIANIPFVVQPIQRGFEAIPVDVREAAACCGLTPWQRFARIEVPLAWPSILTGGILAFAHTLGEFGVVLMVGGNIPGETRTLSIAIYDRMQAFDDRSAGLMAAVLLAVALLTLTLTTVLGRRVGRYRVNRTLTVALRQTALIPLDVTFGCAPGEVLAIFGPSGSGKTTILRSIAGLYRPHDAHVRCGSETWLDTAQKISVPAHRRRVGFVFQEYALFPHLTALDNVRAALGHRPRAERRSRAEQLLDLVHLSAHRDRRPAALSGGERQRVALARALAREPAVLLLDEPFAAVDRDVRRHLQDEIDEVRQSLDIPVILVTHDVDDVVRLATHLLILKNGLSVGAGPLQTLTSRPDLVWLRDAIGLGSLFDATVIRTDPSRGLVELAFDGGTLFAPNRVVTPGTRVRVRIPAREVILATDAPAGLSLHNVLGGTVTALHHDPESDHVVVQIVVGRVKILAEVTKDAVEQLRIVEGSHLHALVKSVSLEVRTTRQPLAEPNA